MTGHGLSTNIIEASLEAYVVGAEQAPRGGATIGSRAPVGGAAP